MSTFENILLEIRDQIAYVTINRPDKLNALNFKTLDELKGVFEVVSGHPEVRAVLLTGSGEKAFVAGADITEIAHLDTNGASRFAINGQKIFQMIEDCPKPVVAAVNGFALGGGCELAMACHMRVASENARFGQPEVNLGIIPGYGGTQRLPQLIGKARAMELMLTADIITAEQAYQMGLVNHLVGVGEAVAKAEEILKKIVQKPSSAVRLVIKATNAGYVNTLNGYQEEADAFGECVQFEDFKEGTSAFIEKRKPNFLGK